MFGVVNHYTLEEVNSFKEKKLEKLVLCESREKEPNSRLFIHRFNSFKTTVTKDGWWDIFTLSETACTEGYYICQIKDFKLDKNGHLMMIVDTIKDLGKYIDEDSIAWDFLCNTGKFIIQYPGHCRERYNLDKLHKTYDEEWKESSFKSIDEFIFSEFLYGTISLDDIANLLNAKSEIEYVADILFEDSNAYSDKYPLLTKKIKNIPVNDIGYVSRNDILHFLEKKSDQYENLKLGSIQYTSILKRTECVFQYYEKIHQQQKEAKKASKKRQIKKE